MRFGFKQPLVWEKRCVTTLITAAEETTKLPTWYMDSTVKIIFFRESMAEMSESQK